MSDEARWDEIYRNCFPSELPWYDLPFLKYVSGWLIHLDKRDLLVAPGCGVGDTVNTLYKKGFRNLVGTDISSEAIKKAKKGFPDLEFICIETEKLNGLYKSANVMDWLNLHQISPDNLPAYLKSLSQISKSLLLVFFYDPLRPPVQKSIIKGSIYNHSPQMVTELLLPLKKVEESSFDIGINKRFGKEHHFKAIAQIYSIK